MCRAHIHQAKRNLVPKLLWAYHELESKLFPMMNFLHFSDNFFEKNLCLEGRCCGLVGRDISFLQVTQHCVATGAPMQEDVSDLNLHGKRVRMISVLLSSEHPAGRGVCLAVSGRCRFGWPQGHCSDIQSATPVHPTSPNASKLHIIRLHFK
jgi:hypothetical protein